MTDFLCKKSRVILKYEGKKLTEKTETFERRLGSAAKARTPQDLWE
jgi:hypothetical protein